MLLPVYWACEAVYVHPVSSQEWAFALQAPRWGHYPHLCLWRSCVDVMERFPTQTSHELLTAQPTMTVASQSPCRKFKVELLIFFRSMIPQPIISVVVAELDMRVLGSYRSATQLQAHMAWTQLSDLLESGRDCLGRLDTVVKYLDSNRIYQNPVLVLAAIYLGLQ